MAVSTPSYVTQGGGLAFGSPFDTSSQSYTAGDLVLFGWWVTGVSGTPSMSVATAPSGGSATTWSTVLYQLIDTETYLCAAWCVIPSSGSYTFRATTGSSNGHCFYNLCTIASGYNTSSVEVSANRIVAATADPATPDRASSGNMRISWYSAKAAIAPTCTGLTKISAADRTLFDNSLSIAYGVTDTDVSWQNVPPLASINIEIAEASGVSTLIEPEPGVARQHRYRDTLAPVDALVRLGPTGGTTRDAEPTTQRRRSAPPVLADSWTLPVLQAVLRTFLDVPELPTSRRSRSPVVDILPPHRLPVLPLQTMELASRAKSRRLAQEEQLTPTAIVAAAASTLTVPEMPPRRRPLIKAATPGEFVFHYPYIISQSTTVASGDATPYTVAYPTVSRGDLLVMLIVVDGVNTLNQVPVGWTLLVQDAGGGNMCNAALYRIADGSESGSASLIGSAGAEQWCGRIVRIGNFDSNTIADFGTYTVTTASTANPPSNTANWGFDDQLWLAYCGVNGNFTVDDGPSNCVGFAALISTGTSAERVSAGFAYIQGALGAFNPTSFDLSALSTSISNTFAVRPYKALVQPILRSTSYTTSASGAHTLSFTLDAGSSRRLLVWLQLSDSATPPAFSSVTYGGVTMSLVTDGTNTATLSAFNSSVHCYSLRESQLPSNGANDIIATLASGSHSITCTALVVSGTAQDSNVSSVDSISDSIGSTITASPTVTEDYSLVVAGHSTNDITELETSVTAASLDMFGRGNASTSVGTNDANLDVRIKELTTESGAQSVTFTGGTIRRLLIAIVLAPAGTESALATYLESAIGLEVRRKLRRAILDQPATLGSTQRSAAPLSPEAPSRSARRRREAPQPDRSLAPFTATLRQQVEPQSEEKPVRKRLRQPEHTDKFAAIVPPALLAYIDEQLPIPPRRRKVTFAIDSEALAALEAPDAPVLPGKPVEFHLTVSEPQEFRLQANAPVEFKLLAPITSFRRPWQ